LLLVVVFGAALGGVLLIRLGSASNSLSRTFANSNQFDELAAMVAGLLGLSAAVAFFTLRAFWRIKGQVGRSSKIATALLYIIVSIAIIVGPLLVQGGNAIVPLSHFTARIVILDILVLAAACPSFCGLLLLADTQREETGRFDPKNVSEAVSSIHEARICIQRFFVGAAALITMAVIVIGGLQSALNTDLQGYEANYASGNIIFVPNIATIPVGAIILYGIFFAALLAFAVIPSYAAWRARAVDLRDRLYRVPDDGHGSQSWYEGRANIEVLLQIRSGFGPTSLAIIGILAPVVGSIISVAIPHF
jgi:hypothetical protein